MICCLNPACENPPSHGGTKFCPSCGKQLIVLRHYRPIRLLGSGGFAKTYLAEDIDKFNELCVIKQFAPQVYGNEALQTATRLFEQEAKRLQHLGEHPRIPTLLAYFHQDNHLYLVQQYIAGKNLLNELEFAGLFNEQKIRKLLEQLLDILKAVHEQKIIHRDIKPENIIRCQSDDKLVLIDFGAAKQLTSQVIAKTGTRIGSLGFASLEQMENRQVYPASDLYSLGVTCFYLMTGIEPWELWKKRGYAWVNNWQQYLSHPVSLQLTCILNKLLQQDYRKRYQSATEVLKELNPLPQALTVVSKSSYHRQLSSTPRSRAKVASPIQPTPTKVTPVKPSSSTAVITKKNNSNFQKFKRILFLSNTFILVCLTTQGYGYWRYKTFPYNPMLLVNNLPMNTSQLTPLNIHTDEVLSVAMSRDGKTLVSGSKDKTIEIWNLNNGKLPTTIISNTDAVSAVSLSPNETILVSGSYDHSIKIWNWQTGKLQTTLNGHTGWVNCLIFSPDGQTLASASGDKTIKIWDMKSGELKTTLKGHTDRVISVAFTPDGKTLVSGSYDKTIKIWDINTGDLKATINGHFRGVSSVAINPDGKTLVSGSSDKTIKIWNLQTGELQNTIFQNSAADTTLSITPDGKTLVSGSYKQINLWDLSTGELKTTFKGHRDMVYSIAVSQDGKTLVSGSKDKTVRVWQIP
ncbi:MAG: serine/threonine-protein kinase [Nostocaceae cyanobacterium]|nr:serine/threonine-protein kinase [Nostocaceae cyanobacterium]